MKRAVILSFIAGGLGFLLACELAMHLLPVSTATKTGYHIDSLIRTVPPHHVFKISTGWDLRNAQTLRANNLGFVAERDFKPDARAVALIGDSFVEASMLPLHDRPAAQLERALPPGRPVYAMGSPGSALLDYAESIRFAHERLGVRDFVVLMERFDVQQSFCESGNLAGRCLHRDTLEPSTKRWPTPSALKQILRHSALAQYLMGQLKLDPVRLRQQAMLQARPATPEVADKARAPEPPPPAASAQELAQLARVTETFFERIRPYRGGRLVIVLDSDRGAILRGDARIPDAAREQFLRIVEAEGALAVDTEPLYRAHGARSELALDVGPYDAHLNSLGVGIAMQAAAQGLR